MERLEIADTNNQNNRACIVEYLRDVPVVRNYKATHQIDMTARRYSAKTA